VVVGGTAATRDVGALVDGLASAAAASGTELRTTTTQAGQTSIVDVVRLGGPAAGGQAAFAGVAVPLPGFLATEGATIATVALLALLAATLTSLAVLVVVDRWVRRPVAELERGVARIADGDYSGDIQVAADDELGRLGQSVNRMARQIAEAVDSTRAALSHLRFVSEALTALDLGAEELSASVARAAAAIAGEGAAAAVIRRRGDATVVVAHGSVPDLGAERAAALRGDRVLSGHRLVAGPWRTSFPLAIDEGVVTGRLVIDSAAEPGTTEMAALGTLANYAGMALDHARLLEQEHETVRRLRAANAARTEFLSTTHHELRTPLSIVLGMAELAESSWDRVGDDARRRYLAGIVAGARRLARTIESVLTMTVLATEEVHLSRRLMPLRPVVDRVVGAAEERWRLEGEREVHVDVDASLRVDADPELFESMLDALIDNAMKFTRSGGRIEVSAHIEDGALVMQVRDDGIGISAAALPHVFERFYQAERGHARQFGGLGLGLTIAQRVCAVHGADIAVQSLQPHGAVATVRWPLAGAVVQSAQDPAVPAI
jgi:signal transduction histidine kinase